MDGKMALIPLWRSLPTCTRCAIPTANSRVFTQTLFHQKRRLSTPPNSQSTPPSIPKPDPEQALSTPINIENLLSTPSWSVSSLLPPSHEVPADFPVTPEKLRHLLRLSALPPPKDAAEESEMMQTLASQLHFVKEIQKVDTTGVKPLRAIRDETTEVERDAEITVESLREAFEKEEVLGKHFKRIRRRQEKVVDTGMPQDWRPLQHAQRSVGKYFVVDRKQVSDE